MKRVYTIAEVGINHNGSLDIAKKLIDVAVFAGCDAVKFQKRNPDISTPEHMKKTIKDTPWGEMTYLCYKKKIEFGKEEYNELNKYCKEKSIEWSASVWDADSLEFLISFNPPWIKIPSAMLTNWKLLELAVTKNTPIILSTGASTLEELDKAYEILKNTKLTLLHCNSCYPAQNNELNLKMIQTFKERYECRIGYSGHEFGLIPTVASVYLGVEVIERHITLERTMWGSDQICSVEPHALIKLIKDIRALEVAYGDGIKRVYSCEREVMKKLR